MKFERPLPKNPNQITVNQHVFPRSAIARFGNRSGRVEVQRLAGGAPFKVKPEHPLFCAMRVWDQTTETFRTHPTELAYAKLADKIVGGHVTALTSEMDAVVSAFYTLWRLRQEARLHPIPDTKLNMVQAERSLSKESEEILEAQKGAFFLRGDTIPSRFMTGMALMRGMDVHESTLRGSHWGIVTSASARFLVPDCPGDLCVVPVSPSICLCKDMPDVALQAAQVGQVNRQLVDHAHSYYFGEELASCPIF